MFSAKRVCVGLVLTILLAAPAWAQDAGIAGLVRDASGAVLPGVTVTATSPVLIEKERVVVSDGDAVDVGERAAGIDAHQRPANVDGRRSSRRWVITAEGIRPTWRGR